MSKRFQHLFTYLISLTALVLSLSVGISAFAYPAMPSNISNLKVTVGSVSMPLVNYPDGSYFDPEKCYMTVAEQQQFGIKAGADIYLRGWECVGFARYVYTALFYKYPQNATIDNYLAYASGSNSYGYTDVIKSVFGSQSIAGGYTAATVKKLFSACKPGAVMRVGGHSMVLMAIYDDGFVIYDANFASSNEVDVRAYTWQSFVDSMGDREIIALHMPKYYPGYSYSGAVSPSPGNQSGNGNEYTVDTSTAGSYVVYNCTSLNVRPAPTTASTAVGSLANGTMVEVLGSYNGWAKIVYGSANCWVSMSYLSGPKKEIPVAFDANGGSISYSNSIYLSGQKFGTLPTGTKSGRTLIGWSNGGTVYTASSIVPDVSSLSLKAVWGIGTFLDVPETSWYASYVESAYQRSLISGNTKFYPNDDTKRADFVTVLSRLYQWQTGAQFSGTSSGIYSDVPYGSYYDTPVAWAYQAGIVKGTGATTFSPNGAVTREQLATFLYRYAQYVGALKGDYTGSSHIYSYADGASVSNYAVSPMDWAVDIGLMQGDDNGCLNPLNAAKRCEMITVIARFMDYIGA